MLPGRWCEIGCTFVLFTNRKSHTGFRLVPKSTPHRNTTYSLTPMNVGYLVDQCICRRLCGLFNAATEQGGWLGETWYTKNERRKIWNHRKFAEVTYRFSRHTATLPVPMIEVPAVSGISLRTVVVCSSPVWSISHKPIICHILEMV